MPLYNFKFWFVLKWQAISNQHLYLQRGKMRFMSAKWKKLKNERIEQIKNVIQGFENSFFHKELKLWIIFYHWDRRVRDIDNYTKIVLDSMNWLVFEDDWQIVELNLRKFYDKLNPRVEISLYTSL